MSFQRLIPLLAVLLFAVIIAAVVIWVKKKDEFTNYRMTRQAKKEWTGTCEFDNPDSGAKCEREEFHLHNHYRENREGKLVTW